MLDLKVLPQRKQRGGRDGLRLLIAIFGYRVNFVQNVALVTYNSLCVSALTITTILTQRRRGGETQREL